MRRAGHVARIEEMINAHKFWSQNLEGRDSLLENR
jgi:hypothetical protein